MTAATSSIVAERIIDGLYLSIVLALALGFVPTIHPLPDKVRGLPVSVAHVRDERLRDARPLLRGLRDHRGLLLRAIMGPPRHPSGHRQGLAAPGREARRNGREVRGWTARLRARPGRARVPRRDDVYWTLNAFGMWILAWGCGRRARRRHGRPVRRGVRASWACSGCAILIPGPPGMLGVFQARHLRGHDDVLPDQHRDRPRRGVRVPDVRVAGALPARRWAASGCMLERERAGLKALEEATADALEPTSRPSLLAAELGPSPRASISAGACPGARARRPWWACCRGWW